MYPSEYLAENVKYGAFVIAKYSESIVRFARFARFTVWCPKRFAYGLRFVVGWPRFTRFGQTVLVGVADTGFERFAPTPLWSDKSV